MSASADGQSVAMNDCVPSASILIGSLRNGIVGQNDSLETRYPDRRDLFRPRCYLLPFASAP